MGIFTGKTLAKVVFTNEFHDTIEVLYDHLGDGTEYISYYVPATDMDNENLKELLSLGYDFDSIEEATRKHNQELVDIFKAVYRGYAELEVKKQIKEYSAYVEEKLAAEQYNISTGILDLVLKRSDDEEFLFRTKLAVFELPIVKESKDRELKQKIRTSKSLLELFGILDIFINKKPME